MNKERVAGSLPGIPMLLVLVVAAIALAIGLATSGPSSYPRVRNHRRSRSWAPVPGRPAGVVIIGFSGLTPVNPNEARALVLFGRYRGTVHTQGLHWVNPFTERRRISVRVRNFETSKLKVNDHDGNPIEIAAVVVWKVTDTAEALFEVDDYENFVARPGRVRAAQPRDVAPVRRPQRGPGRAAGQPGRGRDQLRQEIQDRLETGRRPGHRGPDQPPRLRPRDRQRDAPPPAGERGHRRAHADRRGRGGHGRDGAGAALRQEDRGARRGAQGAMVSNLLVVLCSEHEAQPVLNTGTLYQ